MISVRSRRRIIGLLSGFSLVGYVLRMNISVASKLMMSDADVRLNSPLQAIVGLSLSVGFLLSTEPGFWSAAMDLSESNVGAAGGIMNTAGNLGGVVSTALVPVLIQHFGWTIAFGSASALALCGATLWLFINLTAS